jgi:ABC-type phosphonate transport system ATPase subunit
MQIKSLIFYNKEGDKRVLSFNIGKVNIITGESKTGKTAIIDVVNYCLGSDDCRISEGIIRDTVEWFGILLSYENEEVFIARQNPNVLHQNSTQYIFFSNADKVKIPNIEELQNNSDISTLKDFITKKLSLNIQIIL